MNRQDHRFIGLASIATLMIATGAAGAPPPAPPVDPQVEAGRRVAERNCAQCHAIIGQAVSPIKTAPRFDDFSARYNMQQLNDALKAGLLRAHPSMPDLRLTPTEVRDLTSYILAGQARREV